MFHVNPGSCRVVQRGFLMVVGSIYMCNRELAQQKADHMKVGLQLLSCIAFHIQLVAFWLQPSGGMAYSGR